jgi:ribonuclease HII
MVDLTLEKDLWGKSIFRVAGVDEAGRGPLAGPVVAASVVFPPDCWIDGVDDSKRLTAARRDKLFELIQTKAIGIGVAVISHTVIDEINIYQASLRAMAEAVAKIFPPPEHVLVDGPAYRIEAIPFTPVLNGDARCFSIAAASIIAKVTRDRMMLEYDRMYPLYGFAKHKGYGTREHYEAIRKFGPCDIHRRSFRLFQPTTSLTNATPANQT